MLRQIFFEMTTSRHHRLRKKNAEPEKAAQTEVWSFTVTEDSPQLTWEDLVKHCSEMHSNAYHGLLRMTESDIVNMQAQIAAQG